MISHKALLIKNLRPKLTRATQKFYSTGKPVNYVKRGPRVTLIIQDMQTNIIFIQRKENDVSTAELPSISLQYNAIQSFDDPREAIQKYMSDELSIQPEPDTIVPLASFYTEKSITDEEVLVYYCKVRRYYEEEFVRDFSFRHCTIDEVIEALASNVHTDRSSKKKLNLVDSVSISALGKFIIDRYEHISSAREYFAKIRFAAVGILFGAGVMLLLLGAIPV